LGGGKESSSMPLYLGTSPELNPAGAMPLYISAPVHSGTVAQTLSLFIPDYALQTSFSKKLFIKGPPANTNIGSMPLFIDRGFNNGFTLFVNGGGVPHDHISMYTSGAHYNKQGISLYMKGTSLSGNKQLFIKGPSSLQHGISMTISGKPQINYNTVLYTGGF